MQTLGYDGSGSGGTKVYWWAWPAANYIPRVSLEGSRPGGTRSGCDQGVQRVQGLNLQCAICRPALNYRT